MFHPESFIIYGGLLILFLVVYAQTGLFFCFFLPGGAMMFTAGVLVATGSLPHSIFSVCSILIGASVLGNITGYLVGRKVGPLLYKKNKSKFFNPSHLSAAASFYEKFGGLALSGGLFFPIIRTFAPLVAGMIKIRLTRFILYTFVGSVLWVLSLVLSGYGIGSIPALRNYLPYIIIITIVVVAVPIVVRIVKELKKNEVKN